MSHKQKKHKRINACYIHIYIYLLVPTVGKGIYIIIYIYGLKIYQTTVLEKFLKSLGFFGYERFPLFLVVFSHTERFTLFFEKFSFFVDFI